MIYNFNSLPQWNSQFEPTQPQVRNDTGYDIAATKIGPARRAAVYQLANAKMGDNQFWWPLFVTDLVIDIALAGSTAQSRLTRDFYPRNFVQPNFIIRGQAIDQQDLGMMTDFAHHMQQRMLQNPKQLLAQLEVNGRGLPFGQRQTGLRVTFRAAKALGLKSYSLVNQTLKGQHDTILCQGWVGSMPREHEKGIYAPPYEFQFVVADMIEGPYSEQLVAATQQANWTALLKNTTNLQTTPALIAEAKKNVANAQKNQVNIISNPAPSSTSTSSSPGSPSSNAPAPTDASETAFIDAVLKGLGAPTSTANVNSLAAWFRHEFPSWPPLAANNPMASTQPMPGSTTYNSAGVQNYPNAQEGVQATVNTLTNGNYPCIVAALKSGNGLCGSQCAQNFLTWSGGGYSSVC
jgi:hypothetical protein